MSTSRADHCTIACADALRGSGEILVSPFGVIPPIAARVARATTEPDIVLTDGEARAINSDGEVESWLPFRYIFDLLSSGRRHVFMMPVQIDRFGNMNLSAIGPHHKPKVQVIGSRGAPGNTINHATSYWVPRHTSRTFVEKVDFVSGIGTDRGGLVHQVITNLGVFDFDSPDKRIRVRSLHPGVTMDEVRENTAFDIEGDETPTREPTPDELEIIAGLDPENRRATEL